MRRKYFRQGLAVLVCLAMLFTLPALAASEDEMPEIPADIGADSMDELPETPVAAPSGDDNSGVQLLDTPTYWLYYHPNGGTWSLDTMHDYSLQTETSPLGGWPDYEAAKRTVLDESHFPTREGYTLLGWSRDQNSTTIDVELGGTPPYFDVYGMYTVEVYLYAVWERATEDFSVTLPTSLSAHLNADGSRSMGAASIINTGAANIMVTDVSCEMAAGWTLLDYESTEPSVLPLGEKSVAVSLKQQGQSAASISKNGDILYRTGSFSQLSYGKSAALDYDVLFPVQAKTTSTKVMDVTFVVTAYHNYSLVVTADHGTIDDEPCRNPPLYVPDYSFSHDTFRVAICDNGIVLKGQQSKLKEVYWYDLDGYIGSLPDLSNDANYLGSGEYITIDVEVYGMAYAKYIKVCWNTCEYIFCIETRGQ